MIETESARSLSDMVWEAADSVLRERDADSVHIMTVAISSTTEDLLPKHVLAPRAAVSHGSLDDLTADDLTGDTAPDLILSPLVSRGFDALDLLSLLKQVKFTGRYLVLAAKVPDVGVIRSEIQAHAPDVNVDIIVLDGTSVLHQI